MHVYMYNVDIAIAIAICMSQYTINFYTGNRIDGKSERGTGFIGQCQTESGLPKLVLLTCNHVLPTEKVTQEASFIFGHKDNNDQGTKVKGKELFDMTKFWTEERDLQFSKCTYEVSY